MRLKKVFNFTADLRIKGHVFCTVEDFQDAIEQAITDGEFDWAIAGVDWEETDERMEW